MATIGCDPSITGLGSHTSETRRERRPNPTPTAAWLAGAQSLRATHRGQMAARYQVPQRLTHGPIPDREVAAARFARVGY